MSILKAALLQITPSNLIEENLSLGISACKKAKELGADLALFPEMWQIGYNKKLMTKENAISHEHKFIKTFQELAQNLQMAIAITYLGKGSKKPTNSIAVIDSSGKIILDYSKVHICNFDDSTDVNLESGLEFKVATLKYNNNYVKIGAMICFDREFPESARTLMKQGAEIIIVPNSCEVKTCHTLGDVRLQQFRARAFENMVGVAMTNYPAPKNDGCSCAFNADGKEIIIADKNENIIIADFDLDFIRKWQQKEVWGKKLLQPKKYL